MKAIRLSTLSIAIAISAGLIAPRTFASSLLVDFNSTTQDGGPHPQAGFQSYDAAQEVSASFTTQSYGAFGTTIDLTPEWPNTTDNRVRQAIDRSAAFDGNWTGTQIDLVTDWIGADTRTGNGGNGNYDGTTGTPTHFDLRLAGLPAANYEWVSYHHDTEHVHSPFLVELSTDGGTSFSSIGQFQMTDSTPGGTPASATVYTTGAPQDLPSTVSFPMVANGTDDVVVRFICLAQTAVHQQFFGVNGFELAEKFIFTDLGADSNWSTLGNWTLGEPAAIDDACIGGGFTALVDSAGEAARNLNIAHNQATDPGAGTLNITGGDLLVFEDFNIGNLTFVGSVTQSGGSAAVGGDLVFGPTGGAGDSGGTYNLNGGSLSVLGDIVETVPLINSAQLQLNSGALIVGGDITTQRFALAQAGFGNFSYNIPAGQTVTTTGTTSVGVNGIGDLTLADAGTQLDSLNAFVGEGGGGLGTVTIDNGRTWNVSQYLRIGHNGTGTVNLNSGTLNVLATGGTRGIRVGEMASGDGTFIIGVPGGSGTADPTINHSGFNLETGLSGMARVTMNSGTFNQLTNNLIVGQNATSDGEFVIEDGLIDIENQLRIANGGRGVFTQNGGTVNVGTILDLANNDTRDSVAILNVNGGVLNVGDRVNSDLKIGNENRATSTSTANILGGIVNISRSIRIADNGADSSGTLIVGDGTSNPIVNLNTGAGNNFESADNGTGVFTFNSGTINQANSNFIAGQAASSSVTVRIGGGTTPAIYNLNGGDGNRDWNTNSGDADITILDNADVNIGRTVNLSNNAAGSTLLKIEGGSFDIGVNLAYRGNGDDEVVVSGGELLVGNNVGMGVASSDATEGNVFSVVGDGATTISVGNNFNFGAAGTVKFAPSATGITPIEVGAAVNTNSIDIAFDFSALSSAGDLGDLVLIDKLGAGAINGLFGGFAEEDFVHTFGDGSLYKISYTYNATTGTRGTGNDLALLSAFPPEVAAPVPDQTIFTGSPTLDVALFPAFEDPDDADSALTYTVTANSNPVLVQTAPIASADGILTLTTPCTIIGTATITVEVEDPCGLTVSDTFVVTVLDNVPPVLFSKDIVLNAEVGETAFADFSGVTAVDKVDGPLPVSCTPDDSAPFPIGTHTINCQATDFSGNTGTTTFQVYVLEIVPTPEMVAPEPVVVTNDAAPGAGSTPGLDAAALIRQPTHIYLNQTGDSLVESTLLGNTPPANSSAVFNYIGGTGGALSVKGEADVQRFEYLAMSNDGDSAFRADTNTEFRVPSYDNAGTLTATDLPKATTQAIYQQAKLGADDLPAIAGIFKRVGGVTSQTDTFVSTPSGSVQEGDVVTAVGGATFGQIKSRVVGNNTGSIAFSSSMRGVPQAVSDAVFTGPEAGPLTIAFREGDTAPGTGGAVFATFAAEAINNSGDVAARAVLRNDAGLGVSSANNEMLITNRNGPTEVIAREGDTAPCIPTPGVTFGRITDIFMNDDGSVTFFAFLNGPIGPGSDGSLWRSEADGTIHIVAREGDVANSTEDAYAQILEVTSSEGGRSAFLARLVPGIGNALSTNATGLWVEDSVTPVPQLLLRQGDKFTIAKEARVITGVAIDNTNNAQGGSGGLGRVLNDADQISVRIAMDGNINGAFLLDSTP